MKAAGAQPARRPYKLASLGVIVLAAAAGLFAWHHSIVRPATDDATIDADVVHVARGGGRPGHRIPVTENMHVAKGDLLFQIDPVPYRLAVDQAKADLAPGRRRRSVPSRAVDTQQSAATIAGDQTKRAGRSRPRDPHGRAAAAARREGLCAVCSSSTRRKHGSATPPPRCSRRADRKSLLCRR